MAQSDDSSDKPHEATERKLDEARKRGQLPKLTDLTATAALAGLLLTAFLPDGWLPERIARMGRGLLDGADSIGQNIDGGGQQLTGLMLQTIGLALAPAAVLPAALVLGLLFAMRGLVFAPSKLEPKLSKTSPLANAKQKFGISGLFEFAKSCLKLAAYLVILWLFLSFNLERMIGLAAQSSGQIMLELFRLLLEFAFVVLVIMAVIGGIDQVFQRFDHARQQRMSHQELREDMRQSEGDPHLKQARRSRAMALATNRMMEDVPTASVVIMNPTHFAVALRWSLKDRTAPICVAKGQDEVALAIRDLARRSGVPVQVDPPTARALFASVEVGSEINPEHYAAVAASIRFAELMRRKARKSAWRSGGET